MDIIRVSMLGMCGVIMGFFLKGTRAEYTAFITMGIGIMILGLAVGKLEYLFQTLGNLQKSISVNQEYFYTLIKMVGITYIGQFSAGICKDGGQGVYSAGETEVTGVLIVAEGADNAVTVQKIQQAVMALFQIDAHKIRIIKMK